MRFWSNPAKGLELLPYERGVKPTQSVNKAREHISPQSLAEDLYQGSYLPHYEKSHLRQPSSIFTAPSSSMASSAAAGLLGRQLKQMQGDKDIPGISCGLVDDNVFEWEVMLMISDDCRYYGGTLDWVFHSAVPCFHGEAVG